MIATTAAATTTIEQDLTCGGCGYNLRGLARGGRCPECGHGIDATLAGVTSARAAWLRTMAAGATQIGVAMLITGAGAASLVMWERSEMFMMLPIGACVGALGTWQFATRGPRTVSPAASSLQPVADGRRLSIVALRAAGILWGGLQILMTFAAAAERGDWLGPGAIAQRQVGHVFHLTVAAWAITMLLAYTRAALLASALGSLIAVMQAYVLAALSAVVLMVTLPTWRSGALSWGLIQFLAGVIVCAWSMIYFIAFGTMLQNRAGMMREAVNR